MLCSFTVGVSVPSFRPLSRTDPDRHPVPMVPAALIGILAINRLGAIHAVVFGGFAAGALSQRIEASRPVVILTASCGIEGNKPPIPYREFVEEAIRISTWKPPKTIVWYVARPSLVASCCDLSGADPNKAARPALLATDPQVGGPEEMAEPGQERPRPGHEGCVRACQVDRPHLHHLH